MFNKTFYINKNATGTDNILLDNNHFAIYSDTLLYLLTGIAFVKKKPFCPKYGEMVYYVTVSGYIQEVRFDTDSTLHQLLRKAGKLYRSEEEAKRYLDKDYKDLIIQEEEQFIEVNKNIKEIVNTDTAIINCGAYGKGRIYHLEYTKLADSERGRL